MTRELLTTSTLLLVFCPILSAAAIYDLKNEWSDTTNPNSVWAYRQGASTLPHNDVSVCCSPGFGITGAWAPSPQGGNFLPLWAKATGDSIASGFLAGDIVFHSVDGFNGNPALGQGNVTWTAPISGTIDISGGLWYAQFPLLRSNDFILTLGATILASGTVSATNGRDRANPLTFMVLGLTVTAGDVLQLQVQPSPGQVFGSFAGVNLTITQTESGIPEPATSALLAVALVAFAVKRVLSCFPGPRENESARRL